jgi:alkylation response protein AidB-like acyl-CoA dehydrogenase
MIERSLITPEHGLWRETVRRFVEQEIVPFHAHWEQDGIVPRALWLKAGAAGMLCCTVLEEYGGLGLDYLFEVVLFMAGQLDPVEAAMLKLTVTELHCEAVDKCLQLFGGWGYMWDYPIARAYADSRIVKIAGGSVEVTKLIIARDMFKGRLERHK